MRASRVPSFYTYSPGRARVAERWFIALIAGVFGLTIGSFLNVCSMRWPRDESVVHPPSRCPGCGNRVRWYDNVPVFGWILLRGRCRDCGMGISVQYPLAELTTGLVWAGVFWANGLTPEAARGTVFLTILFGIALSDARFYIIPDQFSLGGAVLGLGLAFLPEGVTPLGSALGIVGGYGVLWLVGTGGTWLIKKLRPGRLEEAGVDSALGGGDVKMMAMVGAFLGLWGVATTLFLGSVLALLVFGPISALTKRLIPLGIFLAAGAAVSYAWGDALLAWYTANILMR
ncbi:MAG: prepilin peptidase [Gemmatimonadetes bacterium]|nr:prepilin peptidase [Gemmatimonadota bacterium]